MTFILMIIMYNTSEVFVHVWINYYNLSCMSIWGVQFNLCPLHTLKVHCVAHWKALSGVHIVCVGELYKFVQLAICARITWDVYIIIYCPILGQFVPSLFCHCICDCSFEHLLAVVLALCTCNFCVHLLGIMYHV